MIHCRPFRGGYRFETFEGSPSDEIIALFPKVNSNHTPVIRPGELFRVVERIGFLPPSGEVERIILNAIDCEPLTLSFNAFLKLRPNLLAEIQTILELIYPKKPITLAISKKPVIATPHRMEVVELKDIYPQHFSEILASSLADKNFFNTDDIKREGILILDRWQVMKIVSSCFEEFGNSDVVVALSGPGVKNPMGYSLPAGTPISVLLNKRVKSGEWVYVKNSLLNGCMIDTEKGLIDSTTHAVMVLEKPQKREFLGFLRLGKRRISYTNTFLSSLIRPKLAENNAEQHGELRNCIACNSCDDICPVGILPAMIYKRIEHGFEDEAKGLKPERCIECGLCTFACPSKIDLMKSIVSCKL
ncbi:MAG: 4Fe-4S dicluster domain-containing protein [Pseudomonadota bacterium]